jgi:hypothetical protein
MAITSEPSSAADNLVVGLAEPQHDIVIAAAVGCLGRRTAFALKAVVTALYEDVLAVI